MPQTAYSINIPAVSYPGQQFDVSFGKDILSALAVAAAIIYGTLVVEDSANVGGADELAGRAPSASGDITSVGLAIGVAIADQARAQNPNVATPQYPQFSAVPCMRVGRIWVNAETAMTDGVAPFIRFASGAGGSILGNFRNSADTATAAQLPATQGIMRGTTSGAGFAVFECNFV